MKTRSFIKQSALSICLIAALLVVLMQNAYAAGISIYAGQDTVSVGNTIAFTIAVPEGSEAWTYSVGYSSNLSLQSGVTDPMGFKGESSRSNTLIFRATSTGTASVWLNAGSYCVDGVDYDASGSASVTVVSASSPSQGYDHTDFNDNSGSGSGDSTDTKSDNCSLATLTVSAGTLSPAFAPDVTEYTVALPVKTEKITLTATPSDSSATVEGAGEVTLNPGENTISIVSTAENGDTLTYTVHAVVAEMPTTFLDYNGGKLGVVKDVSAVQAPAGFAATTISYKGADIPAWKNEGGTITLLYLMDEQYTNAFYAFSEQDGVLVPYLPLTIGTETYLYTGVPQDQQKVDGLAFDSVKAFGQELKGFRYQDVSMADFCVLYLMDSNGAYGLFTYDMKANTLQRFNGAVYPSNSSDLIMPWLYVYIAGGAVVALLLIILILAYVAGGYKRKLRAAASDEAMAFEPHTAASPAAEEPLPETEDARASEDESTTVVEDAHAGEAEPATVEGVPASQSSPVEQPLPAADTVPAEDAPTPVEQTENTDPSPEDIYRTLPLDKLLDDIHDL